MRAGAGLCMACITDGDTPRFTRDTAAVEGAALRRLARARGRELRLVRRLAQAVLRQRSDIETFLVAALQQASCLEFSHT